MYIFTAYIQASVLKSVRKRIRIWSRASIKARHLLRCSSAFFLNFTWTPRHADKLQKPPEWRSTSGHMARQSDGRDEPASEIFFYFVWQLVFFLQGWLKGFWQKAKKKKETHHGVSDAKRSKSLQTNKSGFRVNVAHFRTCLTEIRRLLTKKTSCVGKANFISEKHLLL